MFATSPTLSRCRYPDCQAGIVRQVADYWQCDACNRLASRCDFCSSPNRAEADFCCSCGKGLSTLPAFNWKAGISEAKAFVRLASAPSSRTILKAYAGQLVAADPANRSMVAISAMTNPAKVREIPAYRESGTRLTSPLLMGKTLYWGSESGLWGLSLHRLQSGESPESAAPTPVAREIRDLAAQDNHLFWLSWDMAGLQVDGDTYSRSVAMPTADDARLLAVGSGMAAVLHPRQVHLLQLSPDGDLRRLEVSVPGINDATDPLIDLKAMGPTQLLAVYQKRLSYLFIDNSGLVRVTPVTQQALRQSNFFSAYSLAGPEGAKNLLVTREGWTQLDPVSGFKDYYLLDRGACEFLLEYKLDHALVEVVHVQQGRTFLELHALNSRMRKAFAERPTHATASTFDERFLYILGKKDHLDGVWIHDLCARF